MSTALILIGFFEQRSHLRFDVLLDMAFQFQIASRNRFISIDRIGLLPILTSFGNGSSDANGSSDSLQTNII